MMEAIETNRWMPAMRGRLEERESRKAAIAAELSVRGVVGSRV